VTVIHILTLSKNNPFMAQELRRFIYTDRRSRAGVPRPRAAAGISHVPREKEYYILSGGTCATH